MLNIWISGFLFAASLITLIIAVYSSGKSYVTAAKPFAFMCIASTIYSFGYAMELLNSDIKTALQWNFFQHIGIQFIPTFWVIVALRYCDKEEFLTPFVKTIMFTIPIFMILIRYTNPSHHLFFKNVYMTTNGFFPVMFIEKGPLYILDFIYIVSAMLFSNILYLKLLIQNKGKIKYQSIIMFISSILPLGAFFMLAFNVSPLEIDFIPIVSTISYILLLIGLSKYQFLNIVPLAHYKVFESIKDAVIVLDGNHNIIDFNSAALKVFSELSSQTIGKNLSDAINKHNDFVEIVYNCEEAQYEMKQENCSTFYYVKISTLYGKVQNVIGYIVMLNNISKHIEDMNKLQLAASIDGLTGIYNRRYFFEIYEREFLKAKVNGVPVSLIMMDIDYFKEVNDKFGHQAGDAVLIDVANVCKTSIRSSDILGRFGGEEFIILLPQTRITQAVEAADRIRRKIEKLNVIFGNDNIKITASFGVSGIDNISEINEHTVDVLIKSADDALYTSKRKGRNCINFLPVLKER